MIVASTSSKLCSFLCVFGLSVTLVVAFGGNGHKIPGRQDVRLAASASPASFDSLKNKKVLVVGGSGRVGGSVVTQLLKRGASVTVGGTESKSFQDAQTRWMKNFPDLLSACQDKVNFEVVDRGDVGTVQRVLASTNYDLCVHTAGPFQGRVSDPNGVLQACIEGNVPYIDVCDDYCTACAAKSKFHAMAQAKGVPCIVSTGTWPGVSSLCAKKLMERILETNNAELSPKDLAVDFGFFTAGSGGAGATLLVATFLILAEQALTIVNGRRRPVPAMQEWTTLDFGPIIGKKEVSHLNLLETASIHDVLGVSNVKALFGTAPLVWNKLLGLMAQLPSSLLANEDIMRKLAVFSLPNVRIVDYFAGATNAIRVDVYQKSDPWNVRASAIYGHQDLEVCVGESVVAFCAGLLSALESGKARAGVSFVEEAFLDQEEESHVLRLASVGAHTLEVEGSSKVSVSNIFENHS